KTMETATHGLYLAGGITGRGSINGACYSGFLASQAIADTVPNESFPQIDEDQISREYERVMSFVRTKGEGPTSSQVKRLIRQTMWDKLGPIKNEHTMREGLARLNQIRAEIIPQMRLTTDTEIWNYELVDALDAVDMLDYCELQFHCSLLRKESRGPFYREDYPFIDNESWLKRTIVRLRDSKMDLFTRDVELKYVAPERKKVDYFTSDY
ncbi:MAG: FAD-binding protein, partial [Nitrososphaerota archaeon]|nr:FAD-binding protein [Nitrososphaerota archaeon]